MNTSRFMLAGALSCALLAGAQATTIDLATGPAQAGYGEWAGFNVSDIDALSHGVEWIDNANSLDPQFGTPLSFRFTIAAGSTGLLTVVDAGFSGDRFTLSNFGAFLAATSAVASTTDVTAVYAGTDFDAALADPSFSRLQLTLGAGSYSLGGLLSQSVIGDFDGLPLNATVGGIRLTTVSPVPEPSTYAFLLAGLGAVAIAARRRRHD